jgi:hypothetical protein
MLLPKTQPHKPDTPFIALSGFIVADLGGEYNLFATL